MTVFTNGVFDILHVGHESLLRFCRELAGPAGRVIVGLNSDASVARLKPGRPIHELDVRAAAIQKLRYRDAHGWRPTVDRVEVFEDDEPTELIKRIRPQVLVKGAEYFGSIVPGAEFADELVFAPMTPGVSTTLILAGLVKQEQFA